MGERRRSLLCSVILSPSGLADDAGVRGDERVGLDERVSVGRHKLTLVVGAAIIKTVRCLSHE